MRAQHSTAPAQVVVRRCFVASKTWKCHFPSSITHLTLLTPVITHPIISSCLQFAPLFPSFHCETPLVYFRLGLDSGASFLALLGAPFFSTWSNNATGFQVSWPPIPPVPIHQALRKHIIANSETSPITRFGVDILIVIPSQWHITARVMTVIGNMVDIQCRICLAMAAA